ncbi:hypothetical protein O3G_MSEX015023 [Manduca sexta]|uniref:Uncharacterized protein n=1 Tax=Manduca sexta TaxID=7130 RepID=A0A922D0Z9_MANSE|nr:hypothetical protein O3G_MSEX015023 [Manduca sexta]
MCVKKCVTPHWRKIMLCNEHENCSYNLKGRGLMKCLPKLSTTEYMNTIFNVKITRNHKDV